jgi:predicted RNase H-like HicB family nuclease
MEKKGIEYYLQLDYSILLHQIEDEGEKFWIAEVPELPGCKSHGLTVEQAVKNVGDAKKAWIEDSLEKGEEVPIPVEKDKFSGKLLVRMSHSLHHALSEMADSENQSLNQLMVTILAKEVGKLQVLNRVENKLDKLLERADEVLKRDEQRISIKSMASGLRIRPHNWFSYDQALDATTGYPSVEILASGITGTISPLDVLWKYAGRQEQPHVFIAQIKETEAELSLTPDCSQV